MADSEPGAFRDAVIREGVALAAMAVVLWYFGPGRILIAGLRHKAAMLWRAPADRIDAEVARFRADVSRWDHEQATDTDRGTSGGKPCGC